MDSNCDDKKESKEIRKKNLSKIRDKIYTAIKKADM